MSFTTGKRGDGIVVYADGQLVVANRQELKQKVLEELERGERKFVIDFSRTGYIDSSGIGALVTLVRKVRAQGGELRVTNLNEELTMLFELTKLDVLFRMGEQGGGGAAGTGGRAPILPPPRTGGLDSGSAASE